MRYFTLLLVIFYNSPVFALDLAGVFSSGCYETKASSLQKYLHFIKKDGRCELAIAVMPRPSASEKVRAIMEYHPADIHCIGTVSYGSGIEESSGCGAFYLSPLSANTSTIGTRPAIITGRNCKDAWNDLIKMKLFWFRSGPVEDFIAGPLFGHRTDDNSPTSQVDYEAETVLIYSKYRNLTNWYFAKKKQVEADMLANYQAAKGANQLDPFHMGIVPKPPTSSERSE